MFLYKKKNESVGIFSKTKENSFFSKYRDSSIDSVRQLFPYIFESNDFKAKGSKI